MTPNSHPQDCTNEVMRNIPANLRLVEDDIESAQERLEMGRPIVSPIVVQPVAPATRGLVKPLAIKVVRPIPQRITEQFYDEAFQAGLTMRDTHQAAIVAHDWHRKWTQQDEQGHTMPQQDFYAQQSSLLPAHYHPEAERQGAKNPSLAGDVDESSQDAKVKRSLAPTGSSPSPPNLVMPVPQVVLKPEGRLSFLSSSNSTSSSLTSNAPPLVKRRYVGSDNEGEALPQNLIAPLPVRPLPPAVRPIALRITRPGVVPPHEIHHGGIPRDITAIRRVENVSPMSFSGESESESIRMTLGDKVLERVHLVEEDEAEAAPGELASKVPTPLPSSNVLAARDGLLHALAVTRGDVESAQFKSSLEPLLKYYAESDCHTRPHLNGELSVDGMWLTLSKPSYFASLGENDNGDPMYTLGRMAFDMFSPTNLVCSLQGNFNPVEIVDDEDRKAMLENVPKSLREEVESGKTVLRTYQ